MEVEFTAHNIRLDDGTLTKPDEAYSMESHPWFMSARRIVDTVFPGDKQRLRLADLGCLEGGYAVEFARMGLQVLGIEVRESNLAACNHVKARTDLPNLRFVRDDVLNIAEHGVFDVVFCSGLLYHLDRPKSFLETLAAVTTKLVILQTHFSTHAPFAGSRFSKWARKALSKLTGHKPGQLVTYDLSALTENEGLAGRWFTEFSSDKSFSERERSKWASWDNRRSFWIQREFLLQAIQDVGFDLVMESFDGLRPSIAESMLRGFYLNEGRGTFVGVKTRDAVGGSAAG
jgi:hypothetical protein